MEARATRGGSVEPRYVFFRTAAGCLVGLIGSILYIVLGILAFAYLPVPVWAQILLLTAMGLPIMLPAFLVDRRCSRRGGDGNPS